MKTLLPQFWMGSREMLAGRLFCHVAAMCSCVAQENPKLQGKGEVTCKGGKATPSEIEEATRKAKLDRARQVHREHRRSPPGQPGQSPARPGKLPSTRTWSGSTRWPTISTKRPSFTPPSSKPSQPGFGGAGAPEGRRVQRPSTQRRPQGQANDRLCFRGQAGSAITEKGPKTATRQTDYKETQDQDKQQATAEETSTVSRSKTETANVSESSVTRSADTVAYDVAASKGIDSAMSAVFASGGFDTVPSSELYSATDGAFDLKKFIADYRTGDDISQETRKMATDSCRKVEVPFVAFGTLTLQLKEKDAVTGQTAVGVVVNGQVWDVRKKLAIKAASIGPVQYQALGKSQTEAEQQALKDAGQKAARALVDQLRARGIQ